MRLYSIKTAGGKVIDWAGTQTDAKAAAALLTGVTWKEENIPTDKPGLLAWLKVHATGE